MSKIISKWSSRIAVALFCTLVGCRTTGPITEAKKHPIVTPDAPVPDGDRLALGAALVRPMYQEILPIDLPTVVKVATVQNLNIRQARLAVLAQQGRVDSAKARWFPAIVPSGSFNLVNGGVRGTRGNIVDVGFKTLFSFITIDWMLNPGQVHYDVLASKKRLAASEHEERAVILKTMHGAVTQYFDLVLARSNVDTAQHAVAAARELVRINELKLKAGTGLLADSKRAEAHLAERQQNLAVARARFYQTSVDLALTLRLDSTVTLVPSSDKLPATTLVRNDLDVGQLLAIAVEFRPDLETVRTTLEAVRAQTESTAWGGFGPQFQSAYTVGGINSHFDNPGGVASETGLQLQQRFAAGGGWRLSATTLGDLRTAVVVGKQTELKVERMVDTIRAQVVNAQQSIRLNRNLLELTRRGIEAARESLRLAEANFKGGTMTTLDVLNAQDTLARAELRHARTIIGYNRSQVDLLAAVGLLDRQSVLPQP